MHATRKRRARAMARRSAAPMGRRRIGVSSVVVTLLALGSACSYDADYAAKRREDLLALYPPGTLMRTEVRARFHDRPPLLSG
jgi:hypothetical protein